MAFDKVVDSAVLDAGLKQIADAIREKGGTSDSLAFPAAMAEAIAAIQAGGSGVESVGGRKIAAGTFTPASASGQTSLKHDFGAKAQGVFVWTDTHGIRPESGASGIPVMGLMLNDLDNMYGFSFKFTFNSYASTKYNANFNYKSPDCENVFAAPAFGAATANPVYAADSSTIKVNNNSLSVGAIYNYIVFGGQA